MTNTKPNAELAYRVLDHIDAHPGTWNQTTWDCGTAACFAGWTVRLSGGVSAADHYIGETVVTEGPADIVGLTVSDAAETLLQADSWTVIDDDLLCLFDATNDRDDLGFLVEEIFGPRPQAAHAGAEGNR